MNGYEFLLWMAGIVLVGIPAVLVGIPCVTAVILTWLGERE